MILISFLLYFTAIYDDKSFIKNLNFEQSSHKIRAELTRITDIILNLINKLFN
jgi:hypothetical protein